MKTVAVDTGGTFTDMVVLDHESGEVEALKTPSTPHDPGQAILDALRELLDERLDAGEVASFTHGTTVRHQHPRAGQGRPRRLLITDGFSGVNDVWHIPASAATSPTSTSRRTPRWSRGSARKSSSAWTSRAP